MPRPRTYDAEFRLLVYALKRANPDWGHAKITAELRKRSGGETPSDRTVSRFLQSINSGEESLAVLRTPWRAWEDEDPELREATPYLLSVAGAVQSLDVFSTGDPSNYHLFTAGLWDPVAGADPREDPAAHVPELTLLEARWVARIHNAAPELSLHDTFWTAQDIVARVRVHGVLEPEVPFDHSDLHYLLAIKPWDSAIRYERYLRLVRTGRIPRYRITALADLIEIQPAVPDSLFTRFKGELVGRTSIPVPGDYSLISMFVERECHGLELVRRRALRNDFGFSSSWRNVKKMPISKRLSKSGVKTKKPTPGD